MNLKPGQTFNSIHFPRTVEIMEIKEATNELVVWIETWKETWDLGVTIRALQRREYFNLAEPVDTNTHQGAVITRDEIYRYALWRKWKLGEGSKYVLFIGLNPSRANEFYNDLTITKCIKFAKNWGFDGMYFGNLFAIRSPDPAVVTADLKAAVGHKTDYWLRKMGDHCQQVVFCWGSWAFTADRIEEVKHLFPMAHCLGTTKDGSPRHPSRIGYATKLEPVKNLPGFSLKKAQEPISTLPPGKINLEGFHQPE